MIQGFFAIAMMFRSTALDLLSGKTIKEREKKASSFIRLFIFYWILPFLLVLGVLLGNSLLWNIFAQMQGRSPVFMPTIQLHSLPLMICATSIAAFYEEILYRWYGPKLVSYVFFPREKQQVTNSAYCWWLFIEALFITIFALSHGYGGVFAVTNAFVAGIILRLCVYYTKSPWVGFFSHLAYNLIQFTILLTN
jgi:membrane protease YdiL (CAAX protease family)